MQSARDCKQTKKSSTSTAKMTAQTKIEDSMTLKLVSERAEAELRLINSRELEQELEIETTTLMLEI